jgi:hypothetical protein
VKGKKMKVFLVAGARPNFMKIAPIYRGGVGGFRRQLPISYRFAEHIFLLAFYICSGIK